MINITDPTFYDLNRSRTLLKDWKVELKVYSESAKEKQVFYSILYYVLNITTIMTTVLSSALLSFPGVDQKVPQSFALISSILLGVMTQVKPDSKAVTYSHHYIGCQKLTKQIDFYLTLNVDNNQLQLIMNKVQTSMTTIVQQMPVELESSSFMSKLKSATSQSETLQ